MQILSYQKKKKKAIYEKMEKKKEKIENCTQNLSNSTQNLSIDSFHPKDCLKTACRKAGTFVNLQC